MRAYFHAFLELSEELTEAARQDPEHVRISRTRDGKPRTFVRPIETRDVFGRLCLHVPESVNFVPRQNDWKISLHAVGQEEIQVRRIAGMYASGQETTHVRRVGPPMRPFAVDKTKTGRQLRKYSGASGELGVTFVDDGENCLVHMQPVVRWNGREQHYYIDKQMQLVGPPAELTVFTECPQELVSVDEGEENDKGTDEDYLKVRAEKEAIRI